MQHTRIDLFFNKSSPTRNLWIGWYNSDGKLTRRVQRANPAQTLIEKVIHAAHTLQWRGRNVFTSPYDDGWSIIIRHQEVSNG